MKALFTLGRFLGSRALCLTLTASLVSWHVRAADQVWQNTGTINGAPQIDAVTFINSGVINVSTALPFETSDTLNFTNSGTMNGSPGWFFDTVAANSGQRTMASSFFNDNTGVIGATGGGLIIGGGGIGAAPSYLWVTASNIVNKGTLSVDGNGWLQIIGTNVNVARSGLEVSAIIPTGSFNGQSNYLNDVGIDDIYWGGTNGFGFASASVYNGTTATAPGHQVEFAPGGTGFGFVGFSIAPSIISGYSNATDFLPLTLTNADGSTTNFLLVTNMIKQAVFVSLSDPNLLQAGVTWFPSSTITNPFRTACIEITLPATNVITGTVDQTQIFFYDTLASETNRGELVNLNSTALPPFVNQRPANYLLSRLDSGNRFFFGSPGNVVPGPTYYFGPPNIYSNNVDPRGNFVVGEYAGYSAAVDNLASEPPPIAPGTVTNFPGRVQLYADNLDLTGTRVRGEGEVIVKANHLLSSVNAAFDCENLSYTLGSTNGNLNFVNLSKQSVYRMKGSISAWSGLWSNQLVVVITNNYAVTNITDTNGVVTGTNAVAEPLTNIVTVGFHALIINGDGLAAQLPVTTWDMVIHSTNIVVSDALNLVQTLFLDGTSFTLKGTLNLTSRTLANTIGQSATTSLRNWVWTNAPTLLYFTNQGSLTMPSEGHFGDDGPTPYMDFVNSGNLRAGSVAVNSTYVDNSGTLRATVGPLNLTGATGKFQNGSSTSGGDINLKFGDVKFFAHRLTSVGGLNFTVTDALSDAGPTSGNVFTISDGFSLLVKPSQGDLLGTTFQDSPPNFVEVDHVWAGANRGASASGYSDNVALGKLVLAAPTTNPSQAPFFSFSGAGSDNGLYVDLLDLSSMGTNYVSMMQINPGLTIYFAAAKLGFTPPNNNSGVAQLPEEYLNGQFGGRLVWVSSFAGPNSSTTVIVNGQTVLMNTALRNSKIIDSDGDGLPNFYDTTPLGGSSGGTATSGLVLGSAFANQPSGVPAFSLTWNAQANTAYVVEMTTDLAHPSWQLVTTYTNTSPVSSSVTISDTNNVTGRQRFYRVRVVP